MILHKDRDQNIIVDRVEFWTGTKTAPLPFANILGQIKEILNSYKINAVTGDQFYCDAIGQHLLGLGVIYNVEVFGPQTRATIFTGLKHLMVQGKIQILNDPNLLRQLRTLRVEKSPRGQIDIRPSSGNDDIAVALALAANEAIMQRPPLTIDLVPFDPRPSAASLGLIPGIATLRAVAEITPSVSTLTNAWASSTSDLSRSQVRSRQGELLNPREPQFS